MSEHLIEEARQRAEEVLRGNAGPLGLFSARHAYQQVHARDSMVSSLGLMLLDEPAAHATHQQSLDTLARFQSRLGNVPFCVGFPGVKDESYIATGGCFSTNSAKAGQCQAAVDTLHAGCVDNCLWFILGHYVYHNSIRDTDALRQAWPNILRAYHWLEYQDVNECGLLEVHEAMDWADLLANRYNVLYDNALWFAANKAMHLLAQALEQPSQDYRACAESIHHKLNLLLWIGPEVSRDMSWVKANRQEWLYTMRRVETELVTRPYYLPFATFRDYADRFDTLGNVLAILFGLASQAQAERILDYIHEVGLNEPYPVRVLYPVIGPGERDWRHYYRVRNLNQPDHYHNGGIWPFVGGFYVAALVQAGRASEAERQLARLAKLNSLGRRQPWEFNEWCHGVSGRPMGFDGQSWSAAMYIYAHEAVKRQEPPFFGQKAGW